MNVQVRTSDGRIYDARVSQNASCGDLLQALFHPNPVPKNSSIMARTRLIDPRELVCNTMQHDLFLVGPKPDGVNNNKNQQQQQQHHKHHGHHHARQDPTLEHAREAVHHLQDFVASPNGQPQPQFGGHDQQHQQSYQAQRHQQSQQHSHQQSHHDNRQTYEHEQRRRQQQQQQQPPAPPQFASQTHNHHHHHHQQQQQQQQQQPPYQHQFQPQSPSAASGAGANATSPAPTTGTPAQKKPTTPDEVLLYVRSKVEEFYSTVRSEGCTHKERMWINEMSMKELFRLDAMEGISPEQRAERKRLVNEIQKLQEENDQQKAAAAAAQK